MKTLLRIDNSGRGIICRIMLVSNWSICTLNCKSDEKVPFSLSNSIIYIGTYINLRSVNLKPFFFHFIYLA